MPADLQRQLRWLIGIRLLVIASASLPYFLAQLSNPGGIDLGFWSWIAGVGFAASLLYIVMLRVDWPQQTTQAFLQFLGDLLLVTGLVYFFHGAGTFSILYLLVIICASTILERRAGIAVATGAWSLYAFTTLGLFFGALPTVSGATGASASTWLMSYNLAIHLFGFYAVAILSSWLAQSVKQAERELSEQQAHLAELQQLHSDIIKSIPSGLLTTDLAGNVTSINEAGSSILGQAEPLVTGRPITHTGLFTEDSWTQLLAADPSEPARHEVELRHAEEKGYVGYSISSLTDANAEPVGYLLVFQDLTRWKSLEQEVRLNEQMAAVGEMAASIAHEIGNPLAAISGSVQMLSSTMGDSPQAKLLGIIRKESQRLDRTIKGFLQFARPRERSSVRFDIANLLSENLELLRNSNEVSAQHQLDIFLDPPSAAVVADPDQISQIFWNLARNALRAMPSGGSFSVTGTLRNGHYEMRFSDTGRGMSAGEKSSLFRPFNSLFDEGTGVGMAIVYRIVQEHNGRLSVRSEVDAGTDILVELPAGDRAGARKPVEVEI